MAKTTWNDRRLKNLFNRYNERFWNGKLPQFTIVVRDLRSEDALAMCHKRQKRIEIDLEAHSGDGQIRHTMIHEMCHAATSRGSGHGIEFWRETENILSKCQFFEVRASECGANTAVMPSIPRRFPLTKRAFAQIEKRRRRDMEIRTAGKEAQDLGDLTAEFSEVDAGTLTWTQAVLWIAKPWGLVDDHGQPLSAFAKQMFPRWKRAHTQARSSHLKSRKDRAFWESQKSTSERIVPNGNKLS